jgi:hypothetical protein
MISGYRTIRSKTIEVYDKEMNLVGTYTSYANAARAFGVKVQNVYKVCQGYKTSLNNHYFKIKND